MGGSSLGTTGSCEALDRTRSCLPNRRREGSCLKYATNSTSEGNARCTQASTTATIKETTTFPHTCVPALKALLLRLPTRRSLSSLSPLNWVDLYLSNALELTAASGLEKADRESSCLSRVCSRHCHTATATFPVSCAGAVGPPRTRATLLPNVDIAYPPRSPARDWLHKRSGVYA